MLKGRLKRLALGPEGLPAEQGSRVAAHLHRGGLVVYPTETVYGLGSDAAGAGLKALWKAKDRGPDHPALLALSHRDQARGLRWSPAASALADRFWPGPLTLILPDPDHSFPLGVRSSAGGVAVRVSSHPVPGQIAAALGRPVTSTSANRHGSPPARSAEDATEFAEIIAAEGVRVLMLDGGELPPRPPSTLVDCSSEVLRILREGEIPGDEVLEFVDGLEGSAGEPESHRDADGPRPFRVLFVCSGNTCRSPLAEVLLREGAARRWGDRAEEMLEVRSAGTGAVSGESASLGSRRAAERHDLDLEPHRSTYLDPEVVGWADLVLTMGPHHLGRVTAKGGGDRVSLISSFASGSDDPFAGPPISDPFGGDDGVYESTYLELEHLVEEVLLRLAPSLESD
jgi:protein-tyrosine phosphatase